MTPRKPKTDQKRLPKKSRAKKPPCFQITDRDILLVKAVLNYRFLTVNQFFMMFPESSKQGIQNRLRLLYHNRYLDRINLVGTQSKLIYSLTEKGAKLLAESDGVSRDQITWQRHLNKVGDSHIKHLLSINDLIISLELSLAKAKDRGQVDIFKVLHGNPDQHRISVTLRDQSGARFDKSVIPDAILGIKFRGGEFGLFFIEVDRATMSATRWQDKIIVYHEYARSSELRRRFKTGWFIVLTVTTSDKRILNLAERTVAFGGKRGFWYTTADKVRPESILKPVWVRASDLYSIRNEHTYLIADFRKSDKVSVFDSVRG